MKRDSLSSDASPLRISLRRLRAAWVACLLFVGVLGVEIVDVKALVLTAEFPIATGIATADSDSENPGRPAIGFDGTNYLIVSCRELGSPPGVFGVIVSSAGTVLKNFHISEHQTFSTHHCRFGGFPGPAVAFDGTNYLVVFHRRGQIIGTRVTPAGDVLDGPSGFEVSSGVPFSISNFGPAVSFDGTNYLVVWAKYIDNTHDIYGARVTPSGQVLNEIPIFTAPGGQISPSVAFDGANFLVAWSDTRDGSAVGPNANILGARVTPEAVVLDADGIPLSTASGIQDAPVVSFDGTNYLVTWVDGRNDLTVSQPGLEVFGARVTRDGTLLDGPPDTGGFAISAPAALTVERQVAVAFEGASYLVISSAETYSSFPPAGIFAARISSTGNVVGGGPGAVGIPISIPPSCSCRLVQPSILFGTGSSLVVWVNNSEDSQTTKGIIGAFISPDRPPVASAGADRFANEGATVTLNGVNSSDPDDDTLTFRWTQLAGPPVTLVNVNSATPSFTAPEVDANGASLLFQLVVSDGIFESSPDDITVTVSSAADATCAAAGPIQALLADPGITAGAIKSLHAALTNVNDACVLLDQENFDAGVAKIKTAVSSLEKAMTGGAPAQATIAGLRQLVQAIAGWKIGEAVTKVCASQTNARRAQEAFDKGLSASAASQAIQFFASALNSAEKGISSQVNLTGEWGGTLTVKQGRLAGRIDITAELAQSNTSLTGSFQNSLGQTAQLDATICGLALESLDVDFGGVLAEGSGKANRDANKLTVNLSGMDSGGPFTIRGAITRQ